MTPTYLNPNPKKTITMDNTIVLTQLGSLCWISLNSSQSKYQHDNAPY